MVCIFMWFLKSEHERVLYITTYRLRFVISAYYLLIFQHAIFYIHWVNINLFLIYIYRFLYCRYYSVQSSTNWIEQDTKCLRKKLVHVCHKFLELYCFHCSPMNDWSLKSYIEWWTSRLSRVSRLIFFLKSSFRNSINRSYRNKT